MLWVREVVKGIGELGVARVVVVVSITAGEGVIVAGWGCGSWLHWWWWNCQWVSCGKVRIGGVLKFEDLRLFALFGADGMRLV